MWKLIVSCLSAVRSAVGWWDGALRVRPAVGPGAAGAPLHGGETRQLSHVEVSSRMTQLHACPATR